MCLNIYKIWMVHTIQRQFWQDVIRVKVLGCLEEPDEPVSVNWQLSTFVFAWFWHLSFKNKDKSFKFKLYIFYNDEETSTYNLYLTCMWPPMTAFVWSSCGRKPEFLEETHMPHLVSRWPPNIQKCSMNKLLFYQFCLNILTSVLVQWP